MTLGLLISTILFASTLIGGKAWAQLQTGSDHISPAELRQQVGHTRRQTNAVRARKCMSQFRFQYAPMYRYPTRLLKAGLLTWQPRLRHARAARTRCRSAEAVIRHVFGPTASAALRVAECESHLYPKALNPSSGAAGLFQLMPFHWQGKFDPFNARANSAYAYRLSRGGYSWSAWVCKP